MAVGWSRGKTITGQVRAVGSWLPRGERLAVDCPVCRAAAGDLCTSGAGNPLPALHRSRQRLATRRFLELAGAGVDEVQL